MKTPKIIIAPDSFKGTLSAESVAGILAHAIKEKLPSAQITQIPIADGGEGTLECFLRITGGEIYERKVTGPNFKPVTGKFLLNGDLAVIETAQAAGLPLANPKSAKSTTTYGVGELLIEAEKLGAKRFVLGLGGSATNDGGCGMAAALGTVFYNKDGKSFVPVGETLNEIDRIEFCQKRNITALCDVKNPLYGENGAAFVYAPQKGANEEDVKLLDSNLRFFASKLMQYNLNVAQMPGAGAAGGLGAGVTALMGGTLKRGIDAILELSSFENKAKQVDIVITGEGCLDSQSFCGKVIDGIIAKSGKARILAVVGISKLNNPQQYGIEKVFETNYDHRPFEEVISTAEADMLSCAQKTAEYIEKNI